MYMNYNSINNENLLTVDWDTGSNLKSLSKYCKMDINTYLTNSLTHFEKLIDRGLNPFDTLKRNFCSSYEPDCGISIIISQLMLQQAGMGFLFPSISFKITNKVHEQLSIIRKKTNKMNQHECCCIKDEEQWYNPMYISVLNTVTIQLANDEYIKKISNGNIIKVINDIIAFDYL